MPLDARQRHPLIGAEVRGVDLATPLDPQTVAEIQELWMRHLLLIFSDQCIGDSEQIAFARNFGDLEIHPSAAHRSSVHPEIYRVSNVDEAGNIMAPASREWQYMELTWLWHTDSSFREVPSKGSILHGLEIPPEGGDTLFANMYAAYDALDEATRHRIAGLSAIHSHDQVISRSKGLAGRADKGEFAALPPVRHPLVRVHPVTGRRSLFLSPHTMEGIDGMPEADSRALLQSLIAHATQERFCYRHRWRRDDVIMWDNRCTMHAVMPYRSQEHRRVLHRTTLAGDEPPLAA